MSLSLFAVFLAAALLGSTPFGVVVTRLLGHADPRAGGSRNIGATNVIRTSGWLPGLLTLAGDALKGTLAIAWMPPLLATGAADPALAQSAAALGAVFGHMFSPFTGFKGGKGVATGLGVFAYWMPGPTAWAALAFAAAVGLTRYVSLGSILAACALPLAGGLMGYPEPSVFTAALIASFIIRRHADNIRRLLRGEESRLGRKRPEGSA
ncbi:MAG: glycerol-3-phosphate 1-O-acyltransferase PlsY [Nitrospinota bacterium]